MPHRQVAAACLDEGGALGEWKNFIELRMAAFDSLQSILSCKFWVFSILTSPVYLFDVSCSVCQNPWTVFMCSHVCQQPPASPIVAPELPPM